MQFPTGGIVRKPKGTIRCDSGTDGTVRMKEATFLRRALSGALFFWKEGILMNTKKLATVAILASLSVVLVWLVHVPVFPAVSFLEYDPADIAILICGFAYGPVAGLIATLAAALVQGFTVSAQSGVYGILMHVISTGTFMAVSSIIYNKNKTRKRAAIGIACGALAMTAVMFLANLVVTPYFMMGAVNAETVSVVLGLMPWILAFNLLKAGVNGLVTFFLYKSLSRFLTNIGAK